MKLENDLETTSIFKRLLFKKYYWGLRAELTSIVDIHCFAKVFCKEEHKINIANYRKILLVTLNLNYRLTNAELNTTHRQSLGH